MRRSRLLLFSALISAILVGLIFWKTDLSLSQLGEVISRIPAGIVFICFLLTVCIQYIAAYRWSLTTQRLAPELVMKGNYFKYISLGALTSLLVPQTLAMIGTKGVGLKVSKQASWGKGFFTAAFDHIFDFFAMLAVVPAGFLVLTKVIDIPTALMLTAVNILLVGVILGFAFGWIQKKRGRQMFSRKDIWQIYAVSVLRSWIFTTRGVLVAYAANLPIAWSYIYFSTAAIYIVGMFAVTPSGLGIVEWSWIGVLSGFGVPTEVGAQFSLITRVLVTLFILILGGLALIPEAKINVFAKRS